MRHAHNFVVNNGNEVLWSDFLSYRDAVERVQQKQNMIRDLEGKLQKYTEQLNGTGEKEQIPVLEEYLKRWRCTAEDWYGKRTLALNEFKSKSYLKKIAIARKYEPDVYLHRKEIRTEEQAQQVDYSSFSKYVNQNFSTTIQMLANAGVPGDAPYETRLKKMLDREISVKREDFLHRCTAIVGTITDTSELILSEDGSLNGIVTGEFGQAIVESELTSPGTLRSHNYWLDIKPYTGKADLDTQISAAESKKKAQDEESTSRRIDPERE